MPGAAFKEEELMRINNNIMALNAHRQLGINQANGAKSMERLSSGLRVNRAGDDAAGLAISEKMRGQIRGLKQASRNAQDGISLIQTAEGALNETHAILQRMRELATQSATDTNTKVDRGEIQKEIDQLAAEITRIAANTEFNTQNLLGGEFKAKFHIGANEGQNVDLAINAMTSKALGLESAGKFSATVGSISYETKNTAVKSIEVTVATGTTGSSGTATATLGDDGKITLELTTNDGVSADAVNTALAEFGVTASGVATAGNASFAAKTHAIGGIQQAYANIADRDITGLQFAVNAAGSDISVTKTSGGQVTVTAGQSVTLEGLNDALKDYGISIQSNDKDVNGDTAIGIISGAVDFDVDAGNTPIRVDTQVAADKAITTINDAIETVSAERSKLGAMQNRLEHTIANLGTSAENLQAAESRIRDIDMAEEIMAFTKNNILQQAATAMLAQANAAPQSVLQLLG